MSTEQNALGKLASGLVSVGHMTHDSAASMLIMHVRLCKGHRCKGARLWLVDASSVTTNIILIRYKAAIPTRVLLWRFYARELALLAIARISYSNSVLVSWCLSQPGTDRSSDFVTKFHAMGEGGPHERGGERWAPSPLKNVILPLLARLT